MVDRYQPRKNGRLGMGDYFTVVAAPAQPSSTSLQLEQAEESQALQQSTVRVAVTVEADATKPLMPSSGGGLSQNCPKEAMEVPSCSTTSNESQLHSQPAPVTIGIVLRKVQIGERHLTENFASIFPSKAKDFAIIHERK